MSQLVMVIDKKRCIGCHSCTIACKMENNMPKGMSYTNVYTNKVPLRGEAQQPMDHPAGTRLNNGDFVNKPGAMTLTMDYYTKACQHCENPPCVTACPFDATYKEESNGLVVIDYNKCVGCDLCLTACPFDARMHINEDVPYHEGTQDTPVGGQLIPPHKGTTVEKCTFCKHRVDIGEQPACIEACSARARFFGQKDNPSNEIYDMLNDGTREIEQFFQDVQAAKDAGPNVFILGKDK